MRRLLTLAASVTFFATLALAESWTGKLLDSTCLDQQKNVQACNPTGTTTVFLLLVDGKTYKLDDAGNAKAAEALKNRADRSDPSAPATTEISAKISGSKEGTMIKVETLEVQ
jgi:hypothetical protein